MLRIKTKRVIKHLCQCKDRDCSWYSLDVFSVCPLCAKKVVAKICISQVIMEVSDEDTETK